MVLNPTPEEGKIYRAIRKYRSPGSKSLNVARFLNQLGHEVTVVGFFGPFMGRWLVNECQKQGIHVVEVPTVQDNRISVILLKDGSEEVISDLPMEVTGEEYLQLLDLLRGSLREQSHVVFSGSIAQGIGMSNFGALIDEVVSRGLKVVVDVRSEFLRIAAPSAWLLKVNQHEAEALAEIPAQANVGITCEGMGAVFRSSDGKWFRVQVPQVEAVNTVGAGDVFLAYLLDHYWRTDSWEGALRVAAAAATSSVITEEIGKVDYSMFEDLLGRVLVIEETADGKGKSTIDGWLC